MTPEELKIEIARWGEPIEEDLPDVEAVKRYFRRMEWRVHSFPHSFHSENDGRVIVVVEPKSGAIVATKAALELLAAPKGKGIVIKNIATSLGYLILDLRKASPK